MKRTAGGSLFYQEGAMDAKYNSWYIKYIGQVYYHRGPDAENKQRSNQSEGVKEDGEKWQRRNDARDQKDTSELDSVAFLPLPRLPSTALPKPLSLLN